MKKTAEESTRKYLRFLKFQTTLKGNSDCSWISSGLLTFEQSHRNLINKQKELQVAAEVILKLQVTKLSFDATPPRI